MIDKIEKLNNRQKIILENILQGKEYAISDIFRFFSKKDEYPSQATLRRDISELYSWGFLKKKGKLKTTTYEITNLGIIFSPINAHDYFQIETDKRNGNIGYNFSIFSEQFPDEIFLKKEVEELNIITENFKNKSKEISKTIEQKELERFVIELSWKSSKIEGNTYTLLDTELLLKEGLKASGHSEEEAIMILNHKKAFKYILCVKEKFKESNIHMIEDIHRLLVEGLDVSFGLRSKPVGVTGSKYIPLSIPTQINEALNGLCVLINKMKSPYDKALIALMGISYIQPFEDGNKRTARLFTNAILLAYDCAPLSYRNVDEVNYRESMLTFYEKNSILPMKDIFKKQYIFACENYLKF